MNKAVKAVLEDGNVNVNGYPHSSGLAVARAAIAEKHSTDKYKLTPEVSHALAHCCLISVCLCSREQVM